MRELGQPERAQTRVDTAPRIATHAIKDASTGRRDKASVLALRLEARIEGSLRAARVRAVERRTACEGPGVERRAAGEALSSADAHAFLRCDLPKVQQVCL